ncbi:MAG TPA: gluconate 2-dehydrogenase subunit 3 family protein [Bryobacteraceae bacterium]|nr:gluconate 2-dehydrogenase subunit 3 family protein [Bryobacteraceae bacterium]
MDDEVLNNTRTTDRGGRVSGPSEDAATSCALRRRDLFKITAGAAVAVQLGSAAVVQPKFFTPEEYAVVDELSEIIIPADEKSGGARAARVVDYIDKKLAEAFEQEERDAFRAGLKVFVETPAAEREAVLARASKNEKHPKTADDKFFRLLKEHTIRGYYTSKIGIHDDLEYKGNVYQQGDYAGYLPTKA